MKASEIKLGGFYVSKTGWQVREVAQPTSDGRFNWYDYKLSDGQPIGDGICAKESFAQWAERTAIPDEISRMQTVEARELQLMRSLEFAEAVLKNVPDHFLLSEIRRRGLKLD
jgi:hypothetical protein